MRIVRARVARRLFLAGSVGFGEAYMDGDFETPDLRALLALAALNEDHLEDVHAGARAVNLVRRAWHRLRDNTRAGSRRNIAAHYDLGNAF